MVVKFNGNYDNYDNSYSMNGGNMLSQVLTSSGMSYDKIAWFQQAISGSCNAFGGQTFDQKQSGVLTLTNLISSVICHFGAGGVSEAAEEETDASNNKIVAGGDAVLAKKDELEAKVDEIIKEINNNVASIEEAIKKIEALNGDKEGFGLIKQKLEDEKKKIKEAVDVLNNPKSKKEDKEAALVKLQASCDAIKALLGQANDLKKEVEKLDKKVEDNVKAIDKNVGDANEAIEKGLKDIEGIKIETAAEGVKNITYEKKGVGEVADGTAIQEAIVVEEVGSLGTASGVVAQQEQVAIDLINGGNIHITNSASNLKALGSKLNTMGDDFKTVASYATTIGNAFNDASKIIGSYTAKSMAFIESVGTWSTVVEAANTELQTKINEYRGADEKGKLVTENKDAFKDYVAADKFKVAAKAGADVVAADADPAKGLDVVTFIARNLGIEQDMNLDMDGNGSTMKMVLRTISVS